MQSASLETTSERVFVNLARPLFVAVAILASVSIVVPLSIAGWSLFAPKDYGNRGADWQAHRELCRSLPDELYTKDRWRAVRGYVTDQEGQPIIGALVQSVNLEAILELARRGTPTQPWAGLVEAETHTDERGHYEFPHLAVGARTFCYSAAGKSPVVQELITVQDGVGARLDVTLGAAKELRIWFLEPPAEPGQISLVPHRWWPQVVSAEVARDADCVTVAGLGGPFDKGLIAFRNAEASGWKMVGRFDLTESVETVADLNDSATEYGVAFPEVDCIAAWSDQPAASNCLFYSAISPTALFWNPRAETDTTPIGTSTVRGFGPNPFLPVLIESESGDAWFGMTSEASEFAVSGLQAGYYRVRALRYFAQQTFSRGVFVRPNAVAEVRTGIYEHIDFDEPRSREVMGCVRWESGEPAKNAQVFLQDASDFRRFLQRVTTDEHGFFRVPNVPGAAPYFMFALPADDRTSIKNFVHPSVESSRREIWQELTLSPHSVVGELADAPGAQVELLRHDDGVDRVVWTFYCDKAGKFEVSNVAHGPYRLRARPHTKSNMLESLPFEVGFDDKTTVTQWINASE